MTIHIKMHPTNEIYRRLIATPDLAERTRLFETELFAPFNMAVWGQRMGGMEPMAAIAMLGFFMPEQLAETPPALTLLENAKAWEIAERSLNEGAARFAPYSDRIGLAATNVGIYITDPTKANPINKGYNGMGGTPSEIILTYDTPNDYNLSKLPGMVVHELHHNIRFSLFRWGPHITLGDYMISEGLAESFATAMYGAEMVGYYVSECTGEDLETARRLIAANLTTTDFNLMRGYIFGSWIAGQFGGIADVGMPNFGGYAVGYHTVQAYLRRTGKTIEEATLLPAADIIAQSGYLDV
jgi:uncharacterized protein YjaZ